MSKKDKANRVKLIVNPGAGDPNEAGPRLEQVKQYLAEAGLQVDIALAKPKKEAIPIARKAVKDGYDIIVGMGGDGTLGAVIRGIAGAKVTFGIIPAGTENDIATNLGIPEDMKQACAIIADGHTRKLDLGEISTKKTKKFYFFNVVAVGLTATLFPYIKEVPEGKFDGLKEGIATIFKYDPKPTVYLTLDNDSKIEVETMLVTIVNSPLTGAKNLVAPDASTEDGLLDIVVYPDFNKAQTLAYFAQSAHQGSAPEGTIQRYRARKIKVRTSPKLDIAAEGIILGKGSASIKLHSRALRVLAPEAGAGAEKPSKQPETRFKFQDNNKKTIDLL